MFKYAVVEIKEIPKKEEVFVVRVYGYYTSYQEAVRAHGRHADGRENVVITRAEYIKKLNKSFS